MSSSKETSRATSKGAEEVKQKRFYFPTIGQGVTVFASSQEEAEEKVAAMLVKKEEGGPAKEKEDKPNK